VETNTRVCTKQLNSILKIIWTSLRKIQYSERLSTMVTDLRVRENCKAKQYALFKNMVEDAGHSAITGDCKILMEYSQDLYITKKDYCLKHYIDEIELVVKLVASGNKGFWANLKDCVYHKFGFDFKDTAIISKKINLNKLTLI
jgi:hypothetical protein